MAEAGKAAAGRRAAQLVEDGMHLGLGTGSTVEYFLREIADLDVAGVPTSEQTAQRCRELGIEVLDTSHLPLVDLVVDGADEFDAALNLTKGGGGALLREKVVASCGAPFVVIATPDKQVERLGDSFPLPVEVVAFAAPPVAGILGELGFEVSVRGDGEYRTDNDNVILDARMPHGIEDPSAMEVTLALIPGVVENGLFIGLAGQAIVGNDDGSTEVVVPA